jgi:hypothetical protein
LSADTPSLVSTDRRVGGLGSRKETTTAASCLPASSQPRYPVEQNGDEQERDYDGEHDNPDDYAVHGHLSAYIEGDDRLRFKTSKTGGSLLLVGG